MLDGGREFLVWLSMLILAFTLGGKSGDPWAMTSSSRGDFMLLG
jgi:hypothetical protein